MKRGQTTNQLGALGHQSVRPKPDQHQKRHQRAHGAADRYLPEGVSAQANPRPANQGNQQSNGYWPGGNPAQGNRCSRGCGYGGTMKADLPEEGDQTQQTDLKQHGHQE